MPESNEEELVDDELKKAAVRVYVTCVPDPMVDNDDFWDNVRLALLGLVPLSCAELAGASEGRLRQVADESADLIAHKADVFQYQKAGQKSTGVLSALAAAIALGARQDGGITHLGIHACLEPHEGCRGS
ncbi:hypothetical protein ACF06W_11820 [Streptomyces albus]|uniref:hypothetical protein n=1 Tax=Streptomyces albus TaxID=1888 RepID=UPI0036F80B81